MRRHCRQGLIVHVFNAHLEVIMATTFHDIKQQDLEASLVQQTAQPVQLKQLDLGLKPVQSQFDAIATHSHDIDAD